MISRLPSASFSVCSSSVIRQKITMPTQAKSTAMPWMNDHSHGFACPAAWEKIRLPSQIVPMPWLRKVNPTFQRNGTQSW
ncbi:hypothetical protein BJF90_27840 [Pseudonocardia sp. CNS-004]|nr:hypothetical protein BJF90_27840 [Pseudonocardia sp. CNS-004]